MQSKHVHLLQIVCSAVERTFFFPEAFFVTCESRPTAKGTIDMRGKDVSKKCTTISHGDTTQDSDVKGLTNAQQVDLPIFAACKMPCESHGQANKCSRGAKVPGVQKLASTRRRSYIVFLTRSSKGAHFYSRSRPRALFRRDVNIQ